MTNREKYKAVFGHDPDVDACINTDMECPECPYAQYGRHCSQQWWNMTYTAPKENR